MLRLFPYLTFLILIFNYGCVGQNQKEISWQNVDEIVNQIVQPQFLNEDYDIKVAETLDEACKLLEVGFEYVTDMDGKRLCGKRK